MNRYFIPILLLLSITLSSCYTVIEKNKRMSNSQNIYQTIFPHESIIDSRLLGEWEKSFTVIDVGIGTQLLDFNSNGTFNYQLYFNDFLVEDFKGEFRSLSDTLLIVFSHTEELEKLLLRFENEQLYFRNLESPFSTNHHSIRNYPSNGGFKFIGK